MYGSAGKYFLPDHFCHREFHGCDSFCRCGSGRKGLCFHYADLFSIYAVHLCFVAQNYGAGQMDRAKSTALWGGSFFAIGVGMFFLSFFHGGTLAGIFSSDTMVIDAAADYLKAYAIDCMLTAIFFCYIGFYNGIGLTKFVMIQGILGAFCVRVPVSWFMSRQPGVTLFDIGLATPMSSALQIVLCLGCMLYLKRSSVYKVIWYGIIMVMEMYLYEKRGKCYGLYNGLSVTTGNDLSCGR